MAAQPAHAPDRNPSDSMGLRGPHLTATANMGATPWSIHASGTGAQGQRAATARARPRVGDSQQLLSLPSRLLARRGTLELRCLRL